MENNTWYKSLNRSKLNPPGWVFGVVWPILYLLLAIFFVLLVKDKKSLKSPPLILFIKSSGNSPQTDDILTPTFSNKFPCKILLTPPPKPSELSFFHLFCLKVFF